MAPWSSALDDRFDGADGDEVLALLASEVSLWELKTDIRSEAQDFLARSRQLELSGSAPAMLTETATATAPALPPALPPVAVAEPAVVPAPADESDADEGSHGGSLSQLSGDGRSDVRGRQLAEAREKITGL